MSEHISFKVELQFEGSPEELRKVTDTINELPVRVVADGGLRSDPEPLPWYEISPRLVPWRNPGGWPLPPIDFATQDRLSKLSKTFTRIPEFIVCDIAGGIRNPHIHIKNEVVLLDRENFAEMIALASERITKDIALNTDYATSIGALNRLRS